MTRKSQRMRYPKIAPPREEKMSSPVPMVSEAMIAPGPKNRSHRSGWAVRSASATGSRAGSGSVGMAMGFAVFGLLTLRTGLRRLKRQ